MTPKSIERVMAAAWEAALVWNAGALLRVLNEVDPTGLYRPNAPQAPGLDLEETQDIPLRHSPMMHTLDKVGPGERLRPTRGEWPPGLISEG